MSLSYSDNTQAENDNKTNLQKNNNNLASVTKPIMVEDQRSCKFNNYYSRPIGLFVSVPFVLKQYMQQNDAMSNDHAGIIKDIYKKRL